MIFNYNNGSGKKTSRGFFAVNDASNSNVVRDATQPFVYKKYYVGKSQMIDMDKNLVTSLKYAADFEEFVIIGSSVYGTFSTFSYDTYNITVYIYKIDVENNSIQELIDFTVPSDYGVDSSYKCVSISSDGNNLYVSIIPMSASSKELYLYKINVEDGTKTEILNREGLYSKNKNSVYCNTTYIHSKNKIFLGPTEGYNSPTNKVLISTEDGSITLSNSKSEREFNNLSSDGEYIYFVQMYSQYTLYKSTVDYEMSGTGNGWVEIAKVTSNNIVKKFIGPTDIDGAFAFYCSDNNFIINAILKV